jgi:cytochrome c oxidase cbb3-type subunit 3
MVAGIERPRHASSPARAAALTCIALGIFFGVGCEGPPSASSLNEWTPNDHHSADDDKIRTPTGPQPKGAQERGPTTNNVAQLVELTWRQQCTTCHGETGKGDGQMGPMLQVRDLSNSDWQTKTTDAEIVSTIKNGKNRMPKFDLPEPVLAALVVRIRGLRSN